MKLTAKLRTRVFEAHTRELQRASADARDLSVASLGAMSARQIATLSRVDTGRTRRAYEQASNAMPGVESVPLSRLRQSRFSRTLRLRLAKQADRTQEKVEKQERFVEAVREQYARTGWPSRAALLEKAVDRLERLIKARDRAVDLLETIDAAPETAPISVIGGRRRSARTRSYIGTLARPVFRVYGGTGQVVREGRRSLAIVRNLEPHASFVERRDRVQATVLASFRRQGLSASRGGGYFDRMITAANRVSRRKGVEDRRDLRAAKRLERYSARVGASGGRAA